MTIVEPRWTARKGWHYLPERLIPLVAHLCMENYSEGACAEIVDHVELHGTLPPVDFFDSPAAYAEALVFCPAPAPKARYTDAEWAARNGERVDAP